MHLRDAREYVFPIFLMSATETTVSLSDAIYLGTGFFVTRQGDALTAAHVLPDPSQIPDGKKLVAATLRDGKQQFAWINHAFSLESEDLAIFSVNLVGTPFLPCSEDAVYPGEDVLMVGTPSHRVHGKGLEFRVHKGHVTGVYGRLELSFSVPAGMSGSPVLVKDKVVAVATGRVRSEQIEEYTEELIGLRNQAEEIRITKTAQVIHYGTAYPFFAIQASTFAFLNGLSLYSFINARNAA